MYISLSLSPSLSRGIKNKHIKLFQHAKNKNAKHFIWSIVWCRCRPTKKRSHLLPVDILEENCCFHSACCMCHRQHQNWPNARLVTQGKCDVIFSSHRNTFFHRSIPTFFSRPFNRAFSIHSCPVLFHISIVQNTEDRLVPQLDKQHGRGQICRKNSPERTTFLLRST